MTNMFVYEELDLKSRSFRLIRLCKGHQGPLECELLHAYVGDDESGMEYEALSYTWGDSTKPCSINVNGKVMHITKNLFEVLEQLRLMDEDRFLWIDALCINQDDYKERGHQVRQMASIYERARQVIFWLGTATIGSDRAFHHMQKFERAALNYSCNDWRPSDKRWQFIWSTVNMQFKRETGTSAAMQLTDFEDLLAREWFTRIWIIQEVAKARSARVACGTKSVSARIFALVPSLIGVLKTPRCQAVLDIMPGPSRKFSWWLTDQDLETLLRKFADSRASDPRDMIYALLGISSDANQSENLKPDYEKSQQEVVNSTMAFLLRLDDVGISCACLPPWPLSLFLNRFSKFTDLREDIIVDAFNNQQRSRLWEVPIDGPSQTIEFLDRCWRSGQTVEEITQAVRYPGNTGWELLLDTNQADIEYLNCLSREGRIPPPLLWATQRGREDIAEFFLASGMIDFSAWTQWSGEELLFTAVELGYREIVQVLLERQDVAVDLSNRSGQTPLHMAVSGNHMSIARILLEAGRADINARDAHGRTPLGVAAKQTHSSMIELLLTSPGIDVNTRDNTSGKTPLAAAAERGDTNMVEALLKLEQIDVSVRDESGRTALAVAAEKGRASTVSALLNSHRFDVNSQDNWNFTPLAAAVRFGHKAIVSMLLSIDQVDVNLPKIDWTSSLAVETAVQPLILAIRGGQTAIIKMLIESGRMKLDTVDLPMLMSLILVQTHDFEIYGLLESFVLKTKAAQMAGTTDDTHARSEA